MGPSKGAFWITGRRTSELFFRLSCDANERVVGETEYPLCAKAGMNYNHKTLWAILPKSLTQGKPFEYFPRGRVEIRHSKALVYLNIFFLKYLAGEATQEEADYCNALDGGMRFVPEHKVYNADEIIVRDFYLGARIRGYRYTCVVHIGKVTLWMVWRPDMPDTLVVQGEPEKHIRISEGMISLLKRCAAN